MWTHIVTNTIFLTSCRTVLQVVCMCCLLYPYLLLALHIVCGYVCAMSDHHAVATSTQRQQKALFTRMSAMIPIPFMIFALLFLFPSYCSRNSDPGSHSRLFSTPPHYGSCLAFLSREDFSSFFPRRLASNCAYPRYVRV